MSYTRKARDEGPQPPYPMRPLGPAYHRLLAKLVGTGDRPLVACAVCGAQMIPTAMGAHARCLGRLTEPEPLPGPRVTSSALVDTAPWAHGLIRAATEAEEAKAAEALKAAMPIPDIPVSLEAPPVLDPEDVREMAELKRRIAKTIKGMHQCKVCKRPLIAMQQLTHATCTSPGAAWPGWSLPSSKRKPDAEQSLPSANDDQGPQWTDWAAALVAAGMADPATIPDR